MNGTPGLRARDRRPSLSDADALAKHVATCLYCPGGVACVAARYLADLGASVVPG